jgi:phosphoglycolate phosphatase
MSFLVFDLDGTLIDSRRDLADAANALIVEHGGQPLPVDAITSMVGEGAPLLVRRAIKAAGVDVDLRAALPRFLELYDERLLVHTRLYDGTRDALDRLASDAVMAILTNKPQHHTERILDELRIAPLFRWVIGGDTPHGRKPEPAGLNHLMMLANTSPDDTIMVGDSPIDLRTARAAGTRLCIVQYGFGFDLTVPELRDRDIVAPSPSDLTALLRPVS